MRRAELDGVRGIAILLVLVGHADYRLAPLAAAGVAVFFTLSGYLITSLLLVEREGQGRLDLCRFYVRRSTRLAPPLLMMLAVMGALHGSGSAVLASATWTANYATTFGVDMVPFNHTWSLAVEEQFYLVWPLALLLLLRRSDPARTLRWTMSGLAVWWLVLIINGHPLYAYMALETAGVPILGGCWIALRGGRSERPAWEPLAALMILAGTGVAVDGQTTWVLIPMVVTPFTTAFVAAAANGRWLRCRPLTACGLSSYSMYLWHIPVAWYIGDGRITVFGIAAGALTGLVAYHALERPLMACRAARAHASRASSSTSLRRTGSADGCPLPRPAEPPAAGKLGVQDSTEALPA